MKMNISRMNMVKLPKLNISMMNFSKKSMRIILGSLVLVMAIGAFGFYFSASNSNANIVQANAQTQEVNWGEALDHEFYMPVEKASATASDAENQQAILDQIYPDQIYPGTKQCDINKHRRLVKNGTVAMFEGASECL